MATLSETFVGDYGCCVAANRGPSSYAGHGRAACCQSRANTRLQCLLEAAMAKVVPLMVPFMYVRCAPSLTRSMHLEAERASPPLPREALRRTPRDYRTPLCTRPPAQRPAPKIETGDVQACVQGGATSPLLVSAGRGVYNCSGAIGWCA